MPRSLTDADELRRRDARIWRRDRASGLRVNRRWPHQPIERVLIPDGSECVASEASVIGPRRGSIGQSANGPTQTGAPAEVSVRMPGLTVIISRIVSGLSCGHSTRSPRLLPTGGVIERETSFRTATGDDAVDLTLRIMRENAAQPIEIADVLAQVPLSRRALEIRFKRLVGHTMQKELWRLRTARAKILLSRTALTMPEVAAKAGFSDAQRMYDVFRRITGSSPTAYRQARN